MCFLKSSCYKLESVQHCGGEPEQADMPLMSDVLHHPPTYIHLPFTGGFKSVFAFNVKC